MPRGAFADWRVHGGRARGAAGGRGGRDVGHAEQFAVSGAVSKWDDERPFGVSARAAVLGGSGALMHGEPRDADGAGVRRLQDGETRGGGVPEQRELHGEVECIASLAQCVAAVRRRAPTVRLGGAADGAQTVLGALRTGGIREEWLGLDGQGRD